MYRRAVGDEHPDYALALYNLAIVTVGLGRPAEGLALAQQVEAVHDRLIGQVSGVASERRRLELVDSLRASFHAFLSLVLRHFSTIEPRSAPPARSCCRERRSARKRSPCSAKRFSAAATVAGACAARDRDASHGDSRETDGGAVRDGHDSGRCARRAERDDRPQGSPRIRGCPPDSGARLVA